MTDQNQKPNLIRSFIAMPLDHTVRHNLTVLQSELKAIGSGVRWVAPHNIHLTLVFLSDIDERMVNPISEALDRVGHENASCSVEVKRVGFFGSPRSPKIIWAGLHGNIEPITAVHKHIVTSVQAAGCHPDTKPFKPHLTLGRVRSPRKAEHLVAAIDSRKDMCFGQLDIQCIRLMKSRLTPEGPVYSILHESPLQ